MKSSQSRFLFTIVFLSLSSCNIDEIPPEIVSDVRGWFTIESNNIGVNLAWSEVSDDDIDKYIIFKSTGNSIPQEIGETQSNYFKDNNYGWLDVNNIPNSLIEIFNEVGKVYIPCLIANANAYKNGDEVWETSIDGSIWKQKTFPYQVKCLKWIKDEFNKLSTDNKKLTLRLLAGSGCESILD